jgi:predicted transcriptional regulator
MPTARGKTRPTARPYRITDLAQVRALASPVRQDIVDAVTAMGVVSVATIAQTLGRAPNALYFHIQRLERLGLLVRRETPVTRGRPSVAYDVPGRPMVLVYQPAQSRTRVPMGKLVRSMAASASRSFLRAYGPDATVTGLDRNLWASRSKGWLSPQELRKVNRHLQELMRLLHHANGVPDGERQLMELTFILSAGR